MLAMCRYYFPVHLPGRQFVVWSASFLLTGEWVALPPPDPDLSPPPVTMLFRLFPPTRPNWVSVGLLWSCDPSTRVLLTHPKIVLDRGNVNTHPTPSPFNTLCDKMMKFTVKTCVLHTRWDNAMDIGCVKIHRRACYLCTTTIANVALNKCYDFEHTSYS